MHFSLRFHKYQDLLSRMCTSHIYGFPQSITDRIEMLHWHKINMFSFGSGKKDYKYVTEQHVGDQCAQWSLGFSLGIHRFPERDHCNLTELFTP